MAHYAADCWDLECLIDDDWVECVGCADRQSHDLASHSEKRSMALKRDNVVETYYKLKPNCKKISQKYGDKTNNIRQYLDTLIYQDLSEIPSSLQLPSDLDVTIDNNLYVIITLKKQQEYYPHVIEPSFGIDRLMYAMLEHNFKIRPQDNKRAVLTLNKFMAPYDVAIFQLSNKPDLIHYADKVKKLLKEANMKCLTDDSSTAIGKRYVRADEIGVPYAVTIDFETLKDETVTIRERDSMKQIRVHTNNLITTLNNLNH
jgi:glycyl-tRNA synthetase